MAKAREEIAAQVQAMQVPTDDAVDAIQGQIGEVSEIGAAIASAVQ